MIIDPISVSAWRASKIAGTLTSRLLRRVWLMLTVLRMNALKLAVIFMGR